MKSSDLFRDELIKNYLDRYVDRDAGDLIILWERMAIQIIALVGDGGFNSLYERSLALTQTTFPWLVDAPTAVQSAQRCATLRLRFEEQLIAQARAANHQLLVTLTDLLASLIGERITVVILKMAMDSEHAEVNSTKESN